MGRQSVVIFGALLLAFVVYITVRGQLVQYLATLGLASASNLPSVANGTSGGGGAPSTSSAAGGNIVKDIGSAAANDATRFYDFTDALGF